MTPLNGSAARNKGMALFPRKIDGRYAMIGRQDKRESYLIYSDDLYTWDGGAAPSFNPSMLGSSSRSARVARPSNWTIAGYCSPTESGAVRKYSIGAVLLDKKDPSIVLARSREPLGPSRTRRTRRIRAQTSFIPAEQCGKASVSSCLTQCLTPSPICHVNRFTALMEAFAS